jgi:hypothetical protein
MGLCCKEVNIMAHLLLCAALLREVKYHGQTKGKWPTTFCAAGK